MKFQTIHDVVDFLTSNEVNWHRSQWAGVWYYYAENELYIIRWSGGTPYNDRFFFVRATSPGQALAYALMTEVNIEKPEPLPVSQTFIPHRAEDLIAAKCDELKAMLLEKNRKYGDSALNPCRVFSRANSVEQILVRIDDKLSRIQNRQNDDDEDAVMDLAGYLILLMIARKGQNHD